MKKWLRINITSLTIDLGIIIYARFMLYGIFAGKDGIVKSSSALGGIVLVFLMETVFPLYMGKIRAAYEPYYEKPLGGVLQSAMGFFFYLMMFFVFVAGFSTMGIYKLESSGLVVTPMIFSTVFAMTSGGFGGDYLYKQRLSRDLLPQAKTAFRFTIWIAGILCGYAGIMAIALDVLSAAAGVIVFAVSVTSMIIMEALSGKLLSGLKETSFPVKHFPVIRDFALSLILVTVLGFYMEVLSLSMKISSGLESIIVLTAAGYLPFRIWVEFEPPFTPVTIVTGVCSTGFFIYRLTV